uniref:Transcriptional regulator n=1 Tax=Thermofilum pendens TaxID=2269 RepID=A0A7J3X8C4_THEPE
MDKDRVAGGILLSLALSMGVLYTYLLFLAPDPVSILVLKLTALGVVGSFLIIMGWIGFALLTSPPHKRVLEIERRLAEEFKKLRERGYPFPWADAGGSG